MTYRGEEDTVPTFLTSAIYGVGGHLHTSAASPQAKSPLTHLSIPTK